MRLLLDANIFVEIILEQERAAEAKSLLSQTELHEFFVSDFSLHSVGLLCFRRKRHDVFRLFLKDMLFQIGVTLLYLDAQDMETVISVAQRFNLDFDDAYQCAVATKYNLSLVSFDGDFDRTAHGRQTPAQIMQASG